MQLKLKNRRVKDMKKEELVKALAYLGLNYGKEYTQLETEQIYEFVKEYNNDTFLTTPSLMSVYTTYMPRDTKFKNNNNSHATMVHSIRSF